MISRLVIALTGWFLLFSYLLYDYAEYGSDFLKHIYSPEHPAQYFFHAAMFLMPLVTTYLGYIVGQKDILLKRAETEKAKGESIIEAIGDAISIQDTHFKILYQNQLHREMLGAHSGEYCYKAYQNNDNVCEGCHLAITLKDGRIHSKEQQRKTAAGTVYYEIKSSPLKDSSGNVVAAIEAVRDITARRRAEEELRLSEERFRTLADAAFEAIAITEEGILLDASRQLCDMLGYTIDELRGMKVADIIVPEDRELVRLNQSIGYEAPYENRLLRKDGSVILAESRARHFSIQNRKVRVTVLRDISQRKRAEEDLLKTEKLESLAILAGGIAHDFNNLLTAILGNISLVRMEMKQDDPRFKWLEAAERASYHAKGLTQQLLTFAKGGAPVKSTVALAQFIRDTADFAVRGSNIICDFSFPDGLWPVDVDEGQMGQVFNNLVINSCQAMPGGGKISISAQNIEIGAKDDLPIPQGKYVKICIMDQGTGIPEEHLQRIFDPYFTTKQMGSGLGLSIVYSVIRNHRGHVTVESTLGVGASFTVYIPASPEKLIKKRPEEEDNIVGKGRVLLMDDEDLVREVAGEMLKMMGYAVEFARDGAEAIRLYETAMGSSRPFDAVILDLTVPGRMGGKEAMQKLRQVDPEVKAIVSSGYSQDPVMASFREYGFSEVIAKPYSRLELGRIMHKVIAGPRHG